MSKMSQLNQEMWDEYYQNEADHRSGYGTFPMARPFSQPAPVKHSYPTADPIPMGTYPDGARRVSVRRLPEHHRHEYAYEIIETHGGGTVQYLNRQHIEKSTRWPDRQQDRPLFAQADRQPGEWIRTGYEEAS